MNKNNILVFRLFNSLQKITLFLIVKIKIDCKFAAASPTQLAPFESSRVGTQQRY